MAQHTCPAIPQWDRARALRTLNVEEVSFEAINGNVYEPSDLREYFILEDRTKLTSDGGGYDAKVGSNGLVIWHARLDDAKMPPIIPSLMTS